MVSVDFITESFPGQFKNWFYAMIAMSICVGECKSNEDGFGICNNG